MTNGSRASNDGNAAEQLVAQLLASRDYAEIRPAEKKQLQADIKAGGDPLTCLAAYGGKVFVRQCTGYPTLYGRPARHDFLVQGVAGLADGLIIEMKWQTVGGSVDEKFPFVALSFQSLSQTACLILDGGGATDKACEWVKAQENEKFLVFLGIGNFLGWLRKNG